MNDGTGTNRIAVLVFAAAVLVGFVLALYASGTGTGFVYGNV